MTVATPSAQPMGRVAVAGSLHAECADCANKSIDSCTSCGEGENYMPHGQSLANVASVLAMIFHPSAQPATLR